MKKDSKSYTVLVAFILCLVCSVFVSAAAVILKPVQTVNRVADRQTNILKVLGPWQPGIDVAAVFDDKVESRIIEIESGDYVEGIDPATFDMYKEQKDASSNFTLSSAEDIAGIGAVPKHAIVYLQRDEAGTLKTIVLPVQGYGLWSTMYGYLALEADGNTVRGITFYQQAETPGLGGEVENPNWTALWPGKKVYKDDEVELHLVKGGVNPNAADAEYQVDALAGATLTSRGVTNLIHFWLSDRGFKPYLDRVAKS